MRAELHAASIDGAWLLDATPELDCDERWPEIDAWIWRAMNAARLRAHGPG